MRSKSLGLAVVTLLSLTGTLNASEITWMLVDVSFGSGVTATGQIQLNTVTGEMDAWNISISGLPAGAASLLASPTNTTTYPIQQGFFESGGAFFFHVALCDLPSSSWPCTTTADTSQTSIYLATGLNLLSPGVTLAPLILAPSYTYIIYNNDSSNFVSQTAVNGYLSECPVNFNVLPYPGVPASIDGKPTSMNAGFTPTEANGAVMTLAAAATACGFTGFNWQQQITSLTAPSGVCAYMPSLLNAANISTYLGGAACPGFANSFQLQATPQFPLYDPPPGAYTYDYYDPAYPFYWSASDLLSTLPCILDDPSLIETASNLFFEDCPDAGTVSFQTSLVGVFASGSPSAPLYTWTWQSSFNGTTGGVKETKSTGPPDPGSGTGGVTITSINGVQLPTAVSPSQITTTASGLAYSRVSQTFNGTVTVTNISSSAISGPVQIVFFGMPANVTLVNATNNLSGTPYLTLPALASLAAGQSVTVSVQFKNPSNAAINLTPAIYSGSIN
jgi:hypothetical protein